MRRFRICRPRLPRWRVRLPRLRWPVVLLLALGALVVLLNLRVGPVIRDMAAYQARVLAARAVNEAVAQTMAQAGVGYDQLAVVTRGPTGEVTSIEANMVQINRLNTAVTGQILESVTQLGAERVSLPLGTLLGGQLLAGRGPMVDFIVIPTGYVQTGVINRFDEAGINQTRHQIMMTVELGVMAVLPIYSTETTLNTSVCLAETVIVGSVPDNFTRIDTTGESTVPNLVADYGTNRLGGGSGEPGGDGLNK